MGTEAVVIFCPVTPEHQSVNILNWNLKDFDYSVYRQVRSSHEKLGAQWTNLLRKGQRAIWGNSSWFFVFDLLPSSGLTCNLFSNSSFLRENIFCNTLLSNNLTLSSQKGTLEDLRMGPYGRPISHLTCSPYEWTDDWRLPLVWHFQYRLYHSYAGGGKTIEPITVSIAWTPCIIKKVLLKSIYSTNWGHEIACIRV